SNIIEEQNQIISSPMAQSKLESMVQQNLSSNIIEEQNQTNSCPIPQINLTSNTQAGNNTEYLCNLTSIPIYRLEKRRPLHPQPRWTQKKT
ncbi:unnamed protein product, partial [Rotaria sordida]